MLTIDVALLRSPLPLTSNCSPQEERSPLGHHPTARGDRTFGPIERGPPCAYVVIERESETGGPFDAAIFAGEMPPFPSAPAAE